MVQKYIQERFKNMPRDSFNGDEIDIILSPDKKTYKLSYDGTILAHMEVRSPMRHRRKTEDPEEGRDFVFCEDYDAWWYNKEIEQGHIVKFTVSTSGYTVTIDRGNDNRTDNEELYVGPRFSPIITSLAWCNIDEAERLADGITWKSIPIRNGDEVHIQFAKEKGICISFDYGSKKVYTMSNRDLYCDLIEVARAYEDGFKVVSKISNVEQIYPAASCYIKTGEVYHLCGYYLWIESTVDRGTINKNQGGNFDKTVHERMTWTPYEPFEWGNDQEPNIGPSFGGFTGNPFIGGDW